MRRFLDLFRKLGVFWETQFGSIYMARNSRYAAYEIGEWTYGKPTVMTWNEGAILKIGRFCSISEGVVIMLGGEHRYDWVTTFPFNYAFKEASGFKGHPRTKGDVKIGNDVWIGFDALILSGVTIGNGAVIAARSVVSKDVEPYAIVAGSPAELIKYRFAAPLITALQKIAWWDWPPHKIREAWPLMLSPNIEAFVAKYGEASE